MKISNMKCYCIKIDVNSKTKNKGLWWKLKNALANLRGEK